jgi:hypothetical protein
MNDGWRFYSQKGKDIILFSKISNPALEPTYPPIQHITRLFLPWQKILNVKVTTQFHLKLGFASTPTNPFMTFTDFFKFYLCKKKLYEHLRKQEMWITDPRKTVDVDNGS